MDRTQHNEAEKMRRDALNRAFAHLGDAVRAGKYRDSRSDTVPIDTSKMAVLEGAHSYIQHLEALLSQQQVQLIQRDSLLAQADAKCFGLVAELHRVCHLGGIRPDPSAPFMHQDMSAVMLQSKLPAIANHPSTNDTITLPPISAIQGRSASNEPRKRNYSDSFSDCPSPEQPHSKRGTIAEVPSLSPPQRWSSPDTSVVMISPLLSAQSVPSPVVRTIMKSGRRKGSTNVNKKMQQEGDKNVMPQLLVRIPQSV